MKKSSLIAAVFLLLNGAVLILLWGAVVDARMTKRYGEVVHETVSEFSHIRVRDRDDGIRSLMFVDESGREQRQSAIDREVPHLLQLAYTRTLFSALLFRYPQERILIVGLGGGGMVRFVNHALPESRVEAVEIDPVVVDIAGRYFGVRSTATTILHTEDAFVFLKETERGPYDAIYMDAFLKPTVNPGAALETQQLKTAAFLRDVRDRLSPGGVLAFNLIASDPSTESDLAAIREVFPNVYLFSVPNSGNLVVVASMSERRLSRADLAERAGDPRLPAALPFTRFVEALQ